jgi:hypothetical protein
VAAPRSKRKGKTDCGDRHCAYDKWCGFQNLEREGPAPFLRTWRARGRSIRRRTYRGSQGHEQEAGGHAPVATAGVVAASPTVLSPRRTAQHHFRKAEGGRAAGCALDPGSSTRVPTRRHDPKETSYFSDPPGKPSPTTTLRYRARKISPNLLNLERCEVQRANALELCIFFLAEDNEFALTIVALLLS